MDPLKAVLTPVPKPSVERDGCTLEPGSGGVRALKDLLAVDRPDGGAVVLHVPTGTYLQLDEAASMIVGLLCETRSESDAARELAARANIPLPQAQQDVRSVVRALSAPSRRTQSARRPSLRNALAEGRRWWRLRPAVRWQVVRVVLLLCTVEVGLRTFDVRRLAALARVPLAESQDDRPLPPVAANSLARHEQDTLIALKWIGYRWFFPVTCLRWALVAGFVLRQRAPVLRLGLMKDGVTAHAWIEFDGWSFGALEISGVFRQRSQLEASLEPFVVEPSGSL